MRRLLRLAVLICIILLLTAISLIAWQTWRNEDMGQPGPVVAPEQQLLRGAYLARAGNCSGCHTARGGAAYAGGVAFSTGFGKLYATNITPDRDTGIGNWSADDFWRALHHGRSRDGSFLYPAFPFTSYTQITRADADALYAYLQSLPPVKQANRPQALDFPFNQRILLGLWRTLFFAPGSYQADNTHSAQWNRGAYLVRGLGHCSSCHSSRNLLGGSSSMLVLDGGLIPGLDWYAPALHGGANSLGRLDTANLVALLKNGVSNNDAATGPMAQVVGKSLQYLSYQDVQAMAIYLRSLPAITSPAPATPAAPSAQTEQTLKLGAKLYHDLCLDCHNTRGQGMAPDYPPLNNNLVVTAGTAVNTIRMVLHGGFPPSTVGNPYPFGMPPFGPKLSDEEVAAVVSYVRNSWDNRAGIVTAAEVNRYRSVPLD